MLGSLGVLSSFNLVENIWESYEKFAIDKITESTIMLRGFLFYLKDLKPKQAETELKTILSLNKTLSDFRKDIVDLNQQTHFDFKIAVLDFFEAVDLLIANLQDLADLNGSYKLSLSVLANDWDRAEDQHWDNY